NKILSEKLSLPSYLKSKLLRTVAALRSMGLKVRKLKNKELNTAQKTERIRNFFSSWNKELPGIKKFKFSILDIVERAEEKLIRIEYPGISLVLGLGDDGIARKLNKEQVQQLENKEYWEKVNNRLNKFYELKNKEDSPVKINMGMLETIAGIKPLHKVDIKRSKVKEFNNWLKKIDRNLGLISLNEGIYLYYIDAIDSKIISEDSNNISNIEEVKKFIRKNKYKFTINKKKNIKFESEQLTINSEEYKRFLSLVSKVEAETGVEVDRTSDVTRLQGFIQKIKGYVNYIKNIPYISSILTLGVIPASIIILMSSTFAPILNNAILLPFIFYGQGPSYPKKYAEEFEDLISIGLSKEEAKNAVVKENYGMAKMDFILEKFRNNEPVENYPKVFAIPANKENIDIMIDILKANIKSGDRVLPKDTVVFRSDDQDVEEKIKNAQKEEKTIVLYIPEPEYIKGNGSGIVNTFLVMDELGIIDVEKIRRGEQQKGQFAIILAAGQSKRSHPVANSDGLGDKKLQSAPNGEPYFFQTFKQFPQFYDKNFNGFRIITCDSIYALDKKVELKEEDEYGLMLTGHEIPADSEQTESWGVIDTKTRGGIGKIVGFYEKPGPEKATTRLEQGYGGANYFLASLKMEAVSSFVDAYAPNGKLLEGYYDLDCSGDIIAPSVMNQMEPIERQQYIVKKMKDGKSQELIEEMIKKAISLNNEVNFGFKYQETNSIFADTGNNLDYTRIAQQMHENANLMKLLGTKFSEINGQKVVVGKEEVKVDENVEIGEGVVLSGKVEIQKGKLGKGTIVINSKVGELNTEGNCLVTTVEEHGNLEVKENELVTDVHCKGEKLRIRENIYKNVKHIWDEPEVWCGYSPNELRVNLDKYRQLDMLVRINAVYNRIYGQYEEEKKETDDRIAGKRDNNPGNQKNNPGTDKENVDDETVESLIRDLKNKDIDVRIRAARTLGRIGSKKAVDPLIEILIDESDNDKKNLELYLTVVETLGIIGDERAVKPLIEEISDMDFLVREKVIKSLGMIKDKRAEKPIINALKDNNVEVRISAAEALGELESRKAVVPLIEQLRNAEVNRKEEESRVNSQENIEKAKRKKDEIKEKYKRFRESIAQALGEIGDKRAVKPLTEFLNDDNKIVRERVAEALIEIGDISGLTSVLKRGDFEYRVRAAEKLGEIGNERAIIPLTIAFNDRYVGVRLKAIESLVKINPKKAVQQLVVALGDEKAEVRKKAAIELGKIGDESAVESLKERMNKKDESEEVKQAAEEALNAIYPSPQEAEKKGSDEMETSSVEIDMNDFTTVKDLTKDDIAGKRVLMRVDFNVPIEPVYDNDGSLIDYKITDPTRIERAIPTILEIMNMSPKNIVLVFHFQPKVKGEKKTLTTYNIANKIKELLPSTYKQKIKFVNDSINKNGVSSHTKGELEKYTNGELVVLENIRYAEGEKKGDENLIKQLAELGDIYVLDAFGTIHRKHASMLVSKELPCCVGNLVSEELRNLSKALEPEHPFVGIFGGAKVSEKVKVLESFIERMQEGDAMLIGGAMAYTFIKALNPEVELGDSKIEYGELETARRIAKYAEEEGIKLILPIDHVATDSLEKGANVIITDDQNIPEGYMGVDIGPKTREKFGKIIDNAQFIVGNGPVALFEKGYIEGNEHLVKKINENKDCEVIFGGGETVKAVREAGCKKDAFLSTGGGASVKFLTEGFNLDVLKHLAAGSYKPAVEVAAKQEKEEYIEFGTSGWRGIIGQDFNKDNIEKVTQAIAEYYKKNIIMGKILIGYDPRRDNEENAKTVAAVLASNDIPVEIIKTDVTPSPVLAYMAKEYEYISGVITLTASHNPGEFGGYKWSPYHGGAASSDETRTIQGYANSVKPDEIMNKGYEWGINEGLINEVNPEESIKWYVEDYIIPELKQKGAKQKSAWDSIVSFVKENKDFELILDPMQGTAVKYMDAIYKKIAQEAGRDFVKIINRDNEDSTFSQVNNAPNPTEKESIQNLLEAVGENENTMGLATDGDADRFGVLDFGGKEVTANEILGMLVYFLSEKGEKGSVIKTVATSNFVNKVCEHLNIDLIETPVGFKWAVEKVEKEGVNMLVAGEESAHISVNERSWDDGIMTGLYCLWMVAETKMSLTEYKEQIEKKIGSKFFYERISVKLDEELKQEAAELIKEVREKGKPEIQNKINDMGYEEEVADLITSDGMKAVFSDGSWLLIRLSGTEPVARLYVEGSSEQRKEQLEELGKKLLGMQVAFSRKIAEFIDEDEQGNKFDNVLNPHFEQVNVKIKREDRQKVRELIEDISEKGKQKIQEEIKKIGYDEEIERIAVSPESGKMQLDFIAGGKLSIRLSGDGQMAYLFISRSKQRKEKLEEIGRRLLGMQVAYSRKIEDSFENNEEEKSAELIKEEVLDPNFLRFLKNMKDTEEQREMGVPVYKDITFLSEGIIKHLKNILHPKYSRDIERAFRRSYPNWEIVIENVTPISSWMGGYIIEDKIEIEGIDEFNKENEFILRTIVNEDNQEASISKELYIREEEEKWDKKKSEYKELKSKNQIGKIKATVKDNEAYLTWIVVNDKWEGKGVGKILVDVILSGLEFDKKHKIYTETYIQNTPAIRLLENYGFKQIGSENYKLVDYDKAKNTIQSRLTPEEIINILERRLAPVIEEKEIYGDLIGNEEERFRVFVQERMKGIVGRFNEINEGIIKNKTMDLDEVKRLTETYQYIYDKAGEKKPEDIKKLIFDINEKITGRGSITNKEALNEFVEWYNKNEGKFKENPIGYAAEAYTQLMLLPNMFEDGKCNTACLLASYILLKNDKPPFVMGIENIDKFVDILIELRRIKEEEQEGKGEPELFERRVQVFGEIWDLFKDNVANMEMIIKLNEPAGKTKKGVSQENEYREIGFDGEEPRFGWFKKPSWNDIRENFESIANMKVFKDKKNIVFIGMGGSINTVKTLEKILGKEGGYNVYTLDNLDGEALKNLSELNWEKTLVIPISKSGTTDETIKLAEIFKKRIGKKWRENFLFMTDPGNNEKLAEKGFKGVKQAYIQLDGKDDIGGRFTSPHTNIFWLPLYLLQNKNMDEMKVYYKEYRKIIERTDVLAQVREAATRYANDNSQNFAVVTNNGLVAEALNTWIIQLFQESLGSKIEGFNPRTIVVADEDSVPVGFESINIELPTNNPVLKMMALTYLLEVFVAEFSRQKSDFSEGRILNFVNQPQVEFYKNKLKELKKKELSKKAPVNMEVLKYRIEKWLKDNPDTYFIDAVLYGEFSNDEIMGVKSILQDHFKDKKVQVFVGTDWNHHSFQAAVNDPRSLFVILTKDEYTTEIGEFDSEKIQGNIDTLQRIAEATYETLKDKAIFESLKNEEIKIAGRKRRITKAARGLMSPKKLSFDSFKGIGLIATILGVAALESLGFVMEQA
ncbi:MAG: phosphoglycerate kinase, partial [Elusimicrobiota bacterium]